MRIGSYTFSIGGNMDETLAFYGLIPLRCLVKEDEQEYVVLSSGVKRNI